MRGLSAPGWSLSKTLFSVCNKKFAADPYAAMMRAAKFSASSAVASAAYRSSQISGPMLPCVAAENSAAVARVARAPTMDLITAARITPSRAAMACFLPAAGRSAVPVAGKDSQNTSALLISF